jgi:hypothetical protein
MRHSLVAWMVVAVLWGRACWAQQPAASGEPNDFKPASTNTVGMQMFNITVNHLDKFAYMAGFSPALPPDPINRIYQDPNGFDKKVKVFFLGAGGRERQSNPNIWNLHEALAKAGVKSVYYV